jgi:hypothetical protein
MIGERKGFSGGSSQFSGPTEAVFGSASCIAGIMKSQAMALGPRFFCGLPRYPGEK